MTKFLILRRGPFLITLPTPCLTSELLSSSRDYKCGALTSSQHALMQLAASVFCQYQVWALNGLYSQLRPFEVHNVSEWLWRTLGGSDLDCSEFFLLILWRLWRHRYEALFEGKKTDAMELVTGAWACWDDFRSRNGGAHIAAMSLLKEHNNHYKQAARATGQLYDYMFVLRKVIQCLPKWQPAGKVSLSLKSYEIVGWMIYCTIIFLISLGFIW